MTGLQTFKLPHGLEFNLPSEWWIEAGMVGFRPNGVAYRVANDTRGVAHVRIASIEPLNMSGRKHLDFDGFDRKRMVSILTAIAQHLPLPPIEVVERPQGAYRYRLCNGAHRLYGSAAAGFTMVPTVAGWIPETEAINI